MTELYVFFGALIAGGIVLLYRSRRRTSPEADNPTAAMRFDRTDKYGDPGGELYDGAALAAMRSRPVSRESGHGKDGGG